ncbi:MAG: hypothetical protein ACOYT8_06840 [Candidatus Dependentiae bacterium]
MRRITFFLLFLTPCLLGKIKKINCIKASCIDACKLRVCNDLVVHNLCANTILMCSSGSQSIGAEGNQGAQGTTGDTGIQGETGFTGFTGNSGGVGGVGAQGAIGAVGLRGPVGASIVSSVDSYVFTAGGPNQFPTTTVTNLYTAGGTFNVQSFTVGNYQIYSFTSPSNINTFATKTVDIHLIVLAGNPADAGYVGFTVTYTYLGDDWSINNATVSDVLITPGPSAQHIVISVPISDSNFAAPNTLGVIEINRVAATPPNNEFSSPVYLASVEFRYAKS